MFDLVKFFSHFCIYSVPFNWKKKKSSPKYTQGCRRHPLIFDGYKYGIVWRLTRKTNAAATHATGSAANESPALVFGITNISPNAFQSSLESHLKTSPYVPYRTSLLEGVRNTGRTFEYPSSSGNQKTQKVRVSTIKKYINVADRQTDR